MTRLLAGADGGLVVESPRYRLEVAADGLLAVLSSPEGRHWASLRLIAALDRIDGPDETLAVEPPRVLREPEPVIEIARRSTRWDCAGQTVICEDDAIRLVATVAGRGRLAEAHLLGGRSLLPGRPHGFLPSGSSFRTLFSPNPGDPARLVRSAGEAALVGVVGDSEPGRGHWFFTPSPLLLCLTTAGGVFDPAEPVPEGWLGLGVEAAVDELTFVQLAYQPADRAFSLRLDYEGHTEVDGDFRAPELVLLPAVSDPYAALRRQRGRLTDRGLAPAPAERARPGWWSAPIFCGWGAQCHLAGGPGRAPDLSTQASYDAFLDALEREEVVPGTVVVDDKWQEAYGACVPDAVKWPDLRGWIADRHARGQRVLLWWKAWDPEGLPAELCIRNADGAPVALDPTNPAAAEALRAVVQGLLAPDDLDADGLKVDFTARTPSGFALSPAGSSWGLALLHRLLSIVYAAAKDVKPEALIVTSTPHPSFVDVSDMIRLNDLLRLDDPGPRPSVVPQVRYRAEVVRASCPELLIDTDDWCVPDRATWRELLELKPDLGVPSLYYATHLDLTGEALEAEDYAALRRSWARWEAGRPREAVTAG
jgi:hypothetical protein